MIAHGKICSSKNQKHQKTIQSFFDEKTYLVELVDDDVYGSLQVNR